MILPVTRFEITPTDIAQYVRMERCERFLRLRLHRRSEGDAFLKDAGVVPQSILPLLQQSGEAFEEAVEREMARAYPLRNFAKETRPASRRDDNDAFLKAMQDIPAGETRLFCQPLLRAVLGRWTVRGAMDIVRAERDPDGGLHILIADCKSSAESRVEYRLQTAFYRLMLESLLERAGISPCRCDTAILFRGRGQAGGNGSPSEEERRLARKRLGVSDAFLEMSPDPEAYLSAIREIATGPGSAAERAALKPFQDIHFTFGYKCDGCQFNAFCMKDARQGEDVSLVPYLGSRAKKALAASGIRTVADLAALKRPEEIDPALQPGAGDASRSPAGTVSQLDEIILRARRVAGLASLEYIPGSGHTSLPFASAEQNPNLVCLHLTAQQDYLQGRIFLLGARVVACRKGVPALRRNIVRMTGGPPVSQEDETRLFRDWIEATLKAIVSLAQPDAEGNPAAPIHLIFWNAAEKKNLLQGLGRSLDSLGSAGPALYDLATQIAAYDSPVGSYLDEEVRKHRNYPVLCPSLQNIASYLGFDWTDGERDYRKIFHARMFDGGGRDAATGQGYTRLARFNSQIPADYAYAAWGSVPAPSPDGTDPYRAFRAVTPDILVGFEEKRLEAMEHIASRFHGNDKTEKRPFRLPELASLTGQAETLAAALEEFVLIERHAFLGEWKAARHHAPERRALDGDAFLVSYREEDQEPETARLCRDNEERRRLREAFLAELRLTNLKATGNNLNKAQKEASRWGQKGLRVKLRLETGQTGTDLDTLLGLCDFEEGERFVLFPTLTCDERLPESERVFFQPTPRQMLYGTHVQLVQKHLDYENNRVTSGLLEVAFVEGIPASNPPGFLFGAIDRPPLPDTLYTLDPDPNDINGFWNLKVIAGLKALEERRERQIHALYGRLAEPEAAPGRASRPQAALEGQRRFLEGLQALHAAGELHDFEESKARYIGFHGDDPILLVQGPPGTGKSYATGYAVFARLLGMLRAGLPCRIFLSCKTHKAVDVLIKEMARIRRQMALWRENRPALWRQFFDDNLLDIPVFRLTPRETPPEGVISLTKERAKGEPHNADRLMERGLLIVGGTPGAIYSMIKDRWTNDDLFGHYLCDLLVLDESSQMSLPEAMMASLPLHPEGQLIVAGDIRQMPPIVQHDWKSEPRRTFALFRTYESLFEALKPLDPPSIGFAESFRIHAVVADYLREEIYRHDGIDYHSRKTGLLPAASHPDPFVQAALSPEHPFIIIVHDETSSQNRNAFEESLVGPVLIALAAEDGYHLDARAGMGVVVPHRAQRVALRRAYPDLSLRDESTGETLLEAVDTVERFQGDEREVVLISATESDPDYILSNAAFLFDPRRLTVAISRAKKKLIVVASRSVFEFFSTEEELFLNSQLWKRMLRLACTEMLWADTREGQQVAVWGCKFEGG
ncbi:MAG: PD-(D/E)XK nuclease family protein [Armatimonadetes bacterium]|nr:PD-(D/E)XK nuclease family protein [Armatimonadota bacterium]